MIDLHKEIDFSAFIEEESEIKHFLVEACRKVEQDENDHLRKIKKPHLDDELLNHFVVSGIPVIKEAVLDKFMAVFKNKLLAQRNIGEKNGLLDITAGMQDGVGNQTLYMTYQTSAEAKTAFNKLNNLKFDGNHRMNCVGINDLRAIIDEEEQQAGGDFKAPEMSLSKQKKEHNMDEQFRSQFVLREDKLLYLQWLDHLDKSALTAISSEFMNLECQVNKMVFSPQGSYLAVCCVDGVKIFVGPELKFKGLLRQVNPIDAKFSPDERFIVTFNGNTRKNRENLILWALEEEVKIKAYRALGGHNLNAFEFSDDNKNLAVALNHEVAFYNMSTVDELIKEIRAPEEEQHIIKAIFVQKVAWLKSKNDIIVMCFEPDYNPISVSATRIFLYNSETRVEKKWRAWGEHAKNGEIYVSEKGEWVAISLRKFMKKGHFATSVQIANLTKKMETLEISSVELKEDVGNISFDSNNNRMGVIYKDESIKRINVRYIAVFYELVIKNKSLEIVRVGDIHDNLQNRIVLASSGGFFALYNITEESAERGRFSLGMIVKEQKEKGKKTLAFEFTKQNLMVNGMNFFHVDPSGRFVLLGTDKGYQVWNFIGEIVTKDTLQKNIHDVQWRPRMINRLPNTEEKKLMEDEKEIRKKYELEDDKRLNALKYAKREAKIRQKKEFALFVIRKKDWFKDYVEVRSEILGFKEFAVKTAKYEVEQDFIDLQ